MRDDLSHIGTRLSNFFGGIRLSDGDIAEVAPDQLVPILCALHAAKRLLCAKGRSLRFYLLSPMSLSETGNTDNEKFNYLPISRNDERQSSERLGDERQPGHGIDEVDWSNHPDKSEFFTLKGPERRLRRNFGNASSVSPLIGDAIPTVPNLNRRWGD